MLTGIFTTEQGVINQGYAYLKGFALETIVTAVLFSMIGYFNGHDKTVWVMVQGLVQTLIARLPLSCYVYSAQCQPYSNRACSTNCDYYWYYSQCMFLFLYE